MLVSTKLVVNFCTPLPFHLYRINVNTSNVQLFSHAHIFHFAPKILTFLFLIPYLHLVHLVHSDALIYILVHLWTVVHPKSSIIKIYDRIKLKWSDLIKSLLTLCTCIAPIPNRYKIKTVHIILYDDKTLFKII